MTQASPKSSVSQLSRLAKEGKGADQSDLLLQLTKPGVVLRLVEIVGSKQEVDGKVDRVRVA